MTLVGVVGADAAADEVRALCGAHVGSTAGWSTDAARPTTVKTRYLSGWHQLLRVDAEDASPTRRGGRRTAARRRGEARARGRGSLILSDYAKGVLSEATIAGADRGRAAAGRAGHRRSQEGRRAASSPARRCSRRMPRR